MSDDKPAGVPSENDDEAKVAALGTLGGAATGAAIGLVAGPAGAVIGAAIGAVAGGVAADVAHRQAVEKRERDEELDREIGVTEGNLGEADPNAPPPKLGRYSAASMGVGEGGESTPAEGPIQDVDE
jgi:hypothetical protein